MKTKIFVCAHKPFEPPKDPMYIPLHVGHKGKKDLGYIGDDTGIEISEKAQNEIDFIKKLGYNNLPICMAKTQYSFSDDPKNLECLEPFKIHIQDVVLDAGAEFIVVITGKIFTMPGLPRVPAAENIDIDDNGNIVGIF